jgi:serine/threonine protein kinase
MHACGYCPSSRQQSEHARFLQSCTSLTALLSRRDSTRTRRHACDEPDVFWFPTTNFTYNQTGSSPQLLLIILCPACCCPAAQATKNAELQRVRVLQEIGAMLRVQHHPHAVRLLDAFEDSKGYQLVMPLLKGVCLYCESACNSPQQCLAAASYNHHYVHQRCI